MSGFSVRAKDEREQDRQLLLETTFRVLLTHELADEISPAMARDLFQDAGGVWTPKPELSDVDFTMQPEPQIMQVRLHPDSPIVFRAEGVNLRKIRVSKTDANAWMLSVTGTWPLGADNEAITMIRALKSAIYLTFEQQQPNFLDGGQAPANDAVATVDGGGNVVNIKGRKKKRGKNKPEDEAKAQAAEGAAKAADPGDEQPEGSGPVH